MPYKTLPIVDTDEVPDWHRREPKWTDLAEKVQKLEPGKSLPVLFDNEKEAKRAANAVRDRVNLRAKAVIVRTRLVKQPDGTIKLYLIRTHPVNQEE